VLDEIEPLLRVDLDGSVVAAVLDRVDAGLKQNLPGLEALPRVRDYFNAGVLLIDLKRWREEQVTERAMDYLRQNPKTLFMDQDALNVACDGRWKRVETRWNFQDHEKTNVLDLETSRRPAIIHFVTDQKPWKPGSTSLNGALYDMFRARTRFARTRGQKVRDSFRAVGSRFKRFLKRFSAVRSCWNLLKRLRHGPSG
jgi:lipopolysaccharide biosynthesis glycosyltransferase